MLAAAASHAVPKRAVIVTMSAVGSRPGGSMPWCAAAHAFTDSRCTTAVDTSDRPSS